jgi:hypothetical protein
MALRADDVRARVAAEWAPFWSAVTAAADVLERPPSAGWTAKEMLAHVAFWDEAVVPVVVTMLRGETLPAGWSFGSGDLGLAGGVWPPADVHNAREAAWARTRSPAEVVDRCESAHRQLVDLLATVTDDEVHQHLGYFQGLGSHYGEHLGDLEPGGTSLP